MRSSSNANSKPRKKRHIIANSESSSEHDSYFPDFHQYKKVGMEVEKSRVTSGCWTLDQTRLYLQFLELFQKQLNCEEKRRKCTIFNRMSKAITTRTPDQCRSHHQKMQLKHGTTQNLIESLRKACEEVGGSRKDVVLRPTGATEVVGNQVEGDTFVLMVEWSEVMQWQ